MSGNMQTPFPTAQSLAQIFVLKTTRPSDNGASGPLSPVPDGASFSKPIVKRVYASKTASRGSGASSKNLKENQNSSFYAGAQEEPHLVSRESMPARRISLKSKLRPRRTTSFASLREHDRRESINGGLMKLARKSSRTGSRVSLASPFCSRPSSPEQGEDSPILKASPNGTKRARNTVDRRASKRRNSALATLELEPVLGKNFLPAALPSRSPFDPKETEKPDVNLPKRPSHPSLGIEVYGGRADDLNFAFADVDFNRPPSQLDLYDPMDGGLGYGRYLSADTWIYDENFEAGMVYASTPYSQVRHSKGLSAIGVPRPTVEGVQGHVGAANTGLSRNGSAGSSSTDNMSLTSVMEGSVLHLAGEHLTANLSPWITDSLISPPTMYRKDGDANFGQDAAAAAVPASVANNDFGLALLSSESDTGLLDNLDVGIASTEFGCLASRPSKEGAHNQGGLSPAPVIATKSIASRTRSGTITAAPSPIPTRQTQTRTRSGTVTQNSVMSPMPDSKLMPSGRTRSGTVTALPRSNGLLNKVPSAPTAPVLETAASIGSGVPLATTEDVEIAVHVDSVYDPTPNDDMEFSPAPNPDIDVDSEDEDAPAAISGKASRKLKLPSLITSTESGFRDLVTVKQDGPPPDKTTKTKRPRTSQGKEGSVEPQGPTPGKPFKGLGPLKAALGLNVRNGKSSSGSGNSDSTKAGAINRAHSQPPPTSATKTAIDDRNSGTTVLSSVNLTGGWDPSVLSSDPLDCLSHFDQQAFNAPYEAPPVNMNRRKESTGRRKTSKRGKGKGAKGVKALASR